MKGVVAAGHPLTAEAAATMLRAGGTAFDAALAALATACVPEFVLASLGGGGFMMARRGDTGETVLYDFFAQTPRCKRPVDEIDFHAIHVKGQGLYVSFHRRCIPFPGGGFNKPAQAGDFLETVGSTGTGHAVGNEFYGIEIPRRNERHQITT
jgi:hypothetical protein